MDVYYFSPGFLIPFHCGFHRVVFWLRPALMILIKTIFYNIIEPLHIGIIIARCIHLDTNVHEPEDA